jgi:hypothetical protein
VGVRDRCAREHIRIIYDSITAAIARL